MSQLDTIYNNAYSEAGIRELRLKDKTGKERRYSIRLLGGYTAFAVGLELITVFLPALGSYVDSEKKSDFILPEENAMFSEIALLLVRQMDQINLIKIAQGLLADMTCDGQPVDADAHFKGNLSGFIKVLEFTLKENFSDFFTDYLMEKGLKIRSLGEMMNPVKEEEQEKSEG